MNDVVARSTDFTVALNSDELSVLIRHHRLEALVVLNPHTSREHLLRADGLRAVLEQRTRPLTRIRQDGA